MVGHRFSADMMILLGGCLDRQCGVPSRCGRLRWYGWALMSTAVCRPAIWDRVMRLRTSFFRRYSVGDLTLRILGIDAIRRIFAGQTLNALIGGVFSLANLGIMLIYDGRAGGIRGLLRCRRRRISVFAEPAERCNWIAWF